MYCGNNRNSPQLEHKVIGTRHACLKKGVGVGLNLPFDPDYLGDFDPIDERKIYCGNEDSLPEGYDLVGSNSMCLTKGIGIGKKLKAKKVRSKSKSNRRRSKRRGSQRTSKRKTNRRKSR